MPGWAHDELTKTWEQNYDSSVIDYQSQGKSQQVIKHTRKKLYKQKVIFPPFFSFPADSILPVEHWKIKYSHWKYITN